MVDFLVIGSFSAATYKNVFPLVKDRRIRLGWNRVGEFTDGTRFGNTVWFSDIGGGEPPILKLDKTYDSDVYERFDNYPAINVDRMEDIQIDYPGEMGVPVTFLEKWNENQFDVIRISAGWMDDGFNGLKSQYIDGKKIFTKVFIKRK